MFFNKDNIENLFDVFSSQGEVALNKEINKIRINLYHFGADFYKTRNSYLFSTLGFYKSMLQKEPGYNEDEYYKVALKEALEIVEFLGPDDRQSILLELENLESQHINQIERERQNIKPKKLSFLGFMFSKENKNNSLEEELKKQEESLELVKDVRKVFSKAIEIVKNKELLPFSDIINFTVNITPTPKFSEKAVDKIP